MGAPLLIDVSCLCDAHTDAALDFIYKAASEEPVDLGIWEAHPNPFIRRIVEMFSERGVQRLSGLQDELRAWIEGEFEAVGRSDAVRPTGAMVRWSAEEMGLARLYLTSVPRAAFSLPDWMMLVDYLVQRYLPPDDLRTEADWLATRSALMGRVQAAMGDVGAADADAILAALPSSVETAAATFGLTPVQRSILEFGRTNCAENVTALADGARHRLRRLVVDYQQAEMAGTPMRNSLQTVLLDSFGTLNRDWRRIAVTEATENANQGFVAAQAPGSKLRRVEKYRGACAFCRSIDGRVCEVVAASKPDKDPDQEIWVGKTNVGRSAAPRRREGGELVERESHEMWAIAAGAQHPHCRGSWVRASAASADPMFDAWLADLGARKAA